MYVISRKAFFTIFQSICSKQKSDLQKKNYEKHFLRTHLSKNQLIVIFVMQNFQRNSHSNQE